MNIYKTTIRPMITYAAETANLTLQEEDKLKTLERNIIRRIVGFKTENFTQSRKLMNFEIDEWMEGDNTVKVINAQRIGGHIRRRAKDNPVREITDWRPEGRKARRRP